MSKKLKERKNVKRGRNKEEEKKKNAELRKEEEKSKQKPKKFGSKISKMSPVAAEPSSDSEVDADEEYVVQNREISSNECAICFGLYQNDLSTTGKLMREWVECTNERCKKWMHRQCLQEDNDLYVCGVHCYHRRFS